MTFPTRPAPTLESLEKLLRRARRCDAGAVVVNAQIRAVMEAIDAYAAARAEEARAEVTDQYMDGPSEGSLPREKAMIEAAREAGRRAGIVEERDRAAADPIIDRADGTALLDTRMLSKKERAYLHAYRALTPAQQAELRSYAEHLTAKETALLSPPDAKVVSSLGDYVPTSSVSIEHAGYAPTAPAVERERTAREQGYDNGRANGIREAAAVAVRLDAEWQQADKTGYALIAELIEVHIMALLSPSQPERPA